MTEPEFIQPPEPLRDQPDHTLFWERIVAFALCQRLQIVFDLANDERFAAAVFNAHSGAARLRTIVKVLAWRGDAPLVVGVTDGSGKEKVH